MTTMPRAMNRRRFRRWLRAYLRDTRVLFNQFRGTLLVFAVLLLLGTLSIRATYDAGRLSWGERQPPARHWSASRWERWNGIWPFRSSSTGGRRG